MGNPASTRCTYEAISSTGGLCRVPVPSLPSQVNAEEMLSLAESGRESGAEGGDASATVWMEDKLAAAASELFLRHGKCLPWIAVTNGGLPAYLFGREFLDDNGILSSFWR